VPRPSVSLQLYSVRNALDADLAGTIARVAEIGYRQVEASYKVLRLGPQLLDAIRGNNLTSPTMTSSLTDFDNDEVFTTAQALGADTVIDTFIPAPRWQTPDDVARTAEMLNAAAELAKQYELRVGYHNHWWELETRFDGQPALDRLIDQLEPEVVLEVDAYWVAVGGVDPVEFVTRHADRVRFLHLKDGPINRTNTEQLPAGRGSMPLLDVITAAGNLEVGVVEFDDYAGDVFEAVAASLTYLAPRVGG
jgi:sugar phosphate isomerase/epimerase